MKKITNEEIKVFSKYIYEISGIVLDKSKGYLIETRLRPLMSEVGTETFSELFYKVKSDASGKLSHEIVDAISTNETFFFRDNKPFDLLRNKILPDLIDRRRQQNKSSRTSLRIWSAACSSGQELYSIAMTLKEMLPNINTFNIHILGTDISDKIIAQASYGKYSRFEVERGLPKQYLHRYFNQVGNEWRIKDEIRVMAKFSKINLLKPFPEIGKFDIVFCRNVAIYFSMADRQRMFNNIANVLAPDGALLLGGSESLAGITAPLESRNYLRAIYFQKKGWEKVIESAPVKRVTPSLRTVPIAPPAPRRMPVTRGTMSGLVEKPTPMMKPVASKLKSSPHSAPPSVKTAPAQVSSPSTASPKKEKLPTKKPQGGNLLRTEPQIKKSLLSALQDKKMAEASRLTICSKTVAVVENKEPKTSLLDKIANRHKDKRDKEP